jgi:hypothetical protein
MRNTKGYATNVTHVAHRELVVASWKIREIGAMMTKVFAHHDKSGRVHSLVGFDAPEGSGMSLVAQPDHLVSQVEVPEPQAGPEGLEQLRSLAKNARVEGSGDIKRLVHDPA